jgi:hypothetical protein
MANGTSKIRFIIFLTGALGIGLTPSAAFAQVQALYWPEYYGSEHDEERTARILRASPDGSNVAVVYEVQLGEMDFFGPMTIGNDPPAIYFQLTRDQHDHAVYRMLVDGGEPVRLMGVGGPMGGVTALQIEDRQGEVWLLDEGYEAIVETGFWIYSAETGERLRVLNTPPLGSISSFTLDPYGRYVFWGRWAESPEPSGLYRAGVDGSDISFLSEKLDRPDSFDPVAGMLYRYVAGTGIFRSDIDAAESEIVVEGTSLSGVAYDGILYWTDHAERVLYRAHVDSLLAGTASSVPIHTTDAIRHRVHLLRPRATAREPEAVVRGGISFLAFPVPTRGPIHLEITSEQPLRARVAVYSLDGRRQKTVEAQAKPGATTRLTLDIGGLPAGSYLLVFTHDAGREYRMVVKL